MPWTKNGRRRALARLDLARVRKQLVEKKGWSREKAGAVEKEYRLFLALFIEHARRAFVPFTEDVDQFWHAHMFDSAKYRDDCKAVFGRFIDHECGCS